MYAHGHERGTRHQTRQASSWYDAIAEATLAELDRTWPESNHAVQEVHCGKTAQRDNDTSAAHDNSMSPMTTMPPARM